MRLMSLSALVLFGLAAAPQEGEKVALEWKLKKGDRHRYEANQIMEVDAGGTAITFEMLFGLDIEVTDVTTEGVAKLKVTYDRVKMLMDGPMTAEYDSDKDKAAAEDDITGQVWSRVVNKSFSMDLSRRGECLKIEGHGKIVEEAIKVMPEDYEDQPMAAQMVENMRKQFSDETMKGGFQLLLGFPPKGSVAKGETWTAKHALENIFGKMEFDVTASLKEVRSDAKEAVVKQDAKVTVTPAPDSGMMGAIEIDESKMRSEIVWRTAEGFIESSSGTMTLDGMAGGMEISIVQKLKLKRAPKK